MNRRLLLPGILALVLVIAACGPAPELRNDQLLHDNSLISNEPCAAPCWRGIIPGETSWSVALTIIEDDPQLGDPETRTFEDSATVAAIWQERDGQPCCQMVAEDGETVNLILLQIAPDNTIGQLIEARGEPVYAITSSVSGVDDQAFVNLFYPDDGLIVIAFVAGPTDGEVSASSEIIGAWYVTQEAMDLVLKTTNLHAWEGYAAFSVYADTEDAVFEVTPSVTLTPTPEGE